MELLDSGSSAGTTSQPGAYAWVDTEMLADDEVRVGPPSEPRPLAPDLRSRLERVRRLLLRRPGTPVVAAVVAAILGLLAGGWAVSSQHVRSEAAARDSLVDLAVIGSASGFGEFQQAETLELRLQNRGERRITIASAAMGKVPIDVNSNRIVDPGHNVLLLVPASQTCGQPVFAGDLLLRVTTEDGKTRPITLVRSRDFIVVSDSMATCEAPSLANALSVQLATDHQLSRRSVALTFDFSLNNFHLTQKSQRARLMAVSANAPGIDVTLTQGWPVRLQGSSPSRGALEVNVKDCRMVRLPNDAEGDPLLVVSGRLARNADLETLPLYTGDNLALALQKLILRACPDAKDAVG